MQDAARGGKVGVHRKHFIPPNIVRRFWADDPPTPLPEALRILENALDEPQHAHFAVETLQRALCDHAASIGEREPYRHEAFCSGRFEFRLSQLRHWYGALEQQCTWLRQSTSIEAPVLERLRERVECLRAMEQDLITEALWTDTGQVD